MVQKWLTRLLFLVVFSVHAENNPLTLSAFGTLGITVSDSDHYGFRKDVSVDKGVFSGDVDFLANSLLGGQLDYEINDDVDFVAQAVIRDLSNNKLSRYFTLGFIRYEPTANWNFRAGRIAPDIFLITEYRDVNFAYTWAMAPTEVYGMIPYRHIDGGDVSYIAPLKAGTLTTTLFGGKSEAEFADGSLFLETMELDRMIGVSVSFNLDNWVFQARHSMLRVGNESNNNLLLTEAIESVPDFIWPNSKPFADNLLIKGKKPNYSSLSTQGYMGNWLLTAELAHISSNSIQISTLTSGYASLAYQFDQHTLFGVLGKTSSDTYVFDEPNVKTEYIPELIFAIEKTINFYASKQETLSLGWRWDISSNIATSLQYNHTKIKENGGTLWISPEHDLSADSVNTLMFTASFTL